MRSRADSAGTALAASLLALACGLGLVESFLIPPLPVPGLRIGLANIAVLVALVLLGSVRSLAVSLGRVAVIGLATGTLLGPVGLLSAAGALLAWAAMCAARTCGRDRFSVIGLSLAGSTGHVVGQLLAACAIAGSSAPLFLAPYSLGLSIVSGLLIGYSARLLLSRIPSPVVSFAS